MNKENKILIFSAIGLSSIVFVIGFFSGTLFDFRKQILENADNIEIKEVISLYSKTRSEQVDFEQFWEIWDKVKDRYVDQPVSDVDLFYGAIEGLVAGLKDPHSVYLPPIDAETFAKDLAGEFEGIGAEIGIRDNQLQIIAPLPESPAQKAGLLPGDKILAIDGEDTAGISIEEAVTNIRGKRGTVVTLTIRSNGFESIKDVDIIRQTINVPTVTWEKVEEDQDYAYLRINSFNQDTWDRFDKAVREILRESPKGLIFDLRSNPGGFLDTSIDVASEWVKEGVIVTEKMKDGVSKTHNSTGSHRLAQIPTVLLVDGGSASGSEIVAGALQDYKAATIVGSTTFGKGSVQDFEVLPDGSALKLTIAKWFTPSDRAIDGEGIEPDIILEEMFAPKDGQSLEDENVEIIDLGIKKALEILKEE